MRIELQSKVQNANGRVDLAHCSWNYGIHEQADEVLRVVRREINDLLTTSKTEIAEYFRQFFGQILGNQPRSERKRAFRMESSARAGRGKGRKTT